MIPLILDALAAHRLTRLVTADVITAPVRDRIIEWAYGRDGAPSEVLDDAEAYGWTEAALNDDDPPKLATLVTCRWCTGAWVAAAVVAARYLAPRAWHPVATALAVSSAAALIAGLEDD